MFVSGFTFIILGCSGLLWPVVDVHGFGVRSSYCAKALHEPELYPLPRRECCDRSCSDFIEPGETKHGLTNTNPLWTHRKCLCDEYFYKCLTKNQDIKSIREIRAAFSSELCFDIIHIDCRRGECRTYWEFFPSLTKVPVTVTVGKRMRYSNRHQTNSSAAVYPTYQL